MYSNASAAEILCAAENKPGLGETIRVSSFGAWIADDLEVKKSLKYICIGDGGYGPLAMDTLEVKITCTVMAGSLKVF